MRGSNHQGRWEREEPTGGKIALTDMHDDKTYDEATKVTAEGGEVVLDGPDGVDVKLTPEAAEKTSDELLRGAMEAAGQRLMKGNPHQAR